MRTSWLFLPFLVVLTAQPFGVSQEQKEEASDPAPPKLEHVYSDDFKVDTRQQYEIKGEVSWKPGTLVLGDGASISRVLNVGPWVRQELKVDFPDLGRGNNKAELRLWFNLEGATDCCVRILQENSGGKPVYSLTLFDTGEESDRQVERIVKTAAVDATLPKDLVIEYRHGLVVIGNDNGEYLLTAHINSGGSDVQATKFSVINSGTRLVHFELQAIPRRLYTYEEQRRISEWKEHKQDFLQYYHQGKYAQAAALCERIVKLQRSVSFDAELATSLNNLAYCYNLQGKYAEAEPFCLEAKDIYRQLLGESHPHYAMSVHNLAALHEERADYLGAEALYIEACDIRRRVLGEDHPEFAASLNCLANLYAQQGDYKRAEPLLLKAKDIRKRVLGVNHANYAVTLHCLANLYMNLGDYNRAEPLFVEARDVYRKALGENHPDYATCLNDLACCYATKGDLVRSKQLLDASRNIRKRVLGENHPEYGQSLINLSSVLMDEGDFSKAEQLITKACYIYSEIYGEEHPEYADSLSKLAHLYYSCEDYSASEALYARVLVILNRIFGEEHPGYTRNLHNLASVYRAQGDYLRAESTFVEARRVCRRVHGTQHPNYAACLDSLGSIYGSLEDHARAEALYLEASDIKQRSVGEHHAAYAYSLVNLAGVYQSKFDYERAQTLLVQARSIFQETLGEQNPDYGTLLNSLAINYWIMSDFKTAEALILESMDIRKKVLGDQSLGYAESLTNIAIIYEWQGDYVRAESKYREAREIYKKLYSDQHLICSTQLTNLASLYTKMERLTEAEDQLQQSLDIGVSVFDKVIPGLSEAQSLEWLQSTPLPADRLLALNRSQQKNSTRDCYACVWRTSALLSRLRAISGSPMDASLREVANHLREVRLKLARLANATPRPDEAAGIQQQLAQASQRKEDLEKQLARLNPRTERDLAIRDAKMEELIGRIPAGTAVVDFALLNDWKVIETQVELKQEDGTVETKQVKKLEATPVYDAFVLRSDSDEEVNWVQLGDAEPVDEAVSKWRERLTGLNYVGDSILSSSITDSADENPEERLRALIWEKLEPYLNGCSTVIVLPDGELNRIPWAALPGRKNGSYLLEDYAISTANYGQQLYGLLSEESVKAGSLLLAGGIDYDRRGGETDSAPDNSPVQTLLAGKRRSPALADEDQPEWSFLKAAEVEAESIRNLWTIQGEVVRLTGPDVSETRLARELVGCRFAHLATHGFFAAEGIKSIFQIDLRQQAAFQNGPKPTASGGTIGARNPLLLSGIVLSGANLPPETDELGIPTGEDGILTGEEIVGLDLHNVELVTLSACETGLGDIAAGEGVYGLQRALHQAGVRSVIASLWKVDDKATQTLMVEFYKNLWQKNLGKAESLRQAQLTMLRNYDAKSGTLRSIGGKSIPINPQRSPTTLDPRFWAAFQISGDWR